MPYELIDHTADTGLDLRADSLEELFHDAFRGMMNVLGFTDVREQDERSITLEPSPLDLLLVEWLRELLTRYDRDKFVPASVEMKQVTEDNGLTAVVHGESYDLSRHHPQTEIKGVTYHDLSVRESENGWKGRVIFDL